jgi:hypothetical protein
MITQNPIDVNIPVATDSAVVTITKVGSVVASSPSPSANQTTTVRAYNAASQTLIAANALRKSFQIQNLTDRSLYIHYGAVAAVVGSDILVQANTLYEPPANIDPTVEIRGIGAAGGVGNIIIVEFLA